MLTTTVPVRTHPLPTAATLRTIYRLIRARPCAHDWLVRDPATGAITHACPLAACGLLLGLAPEATGADHLDALVVAQRYGLTFARACGLTDGWDDARTQLQAMPGLTAAEDYWDGWRTGQGWRRELGPVGGG